MIYNNNITLLGHVDYSIRIIIVKRKKEYPLKLYIIVFILFHAYAQQTRPDEAKLCK